MDLKVRRNKMTPRYIGHRGVLTPWYLILFWIFTGSSLQLSPVLRTPGSFDSSTLRLLDFQQINNCDSPVLRTSGSLDSRVLRTPGRLTLWCIGHWSHFKMLITSPRSKNYQNVPRTSLMGPGGAVWGKNWPHKISWDCPFNPEFVYTSRWPKRLFDLKLSPSSSCVGAIEK